MSTMALVQGPNGVIGAWETDGQIYFANLNAKSTKFAKPQSAPQSGNNRKHPALAVTSRGEMILAWTEGTDWQQGGDLVWQVFDEAGKPTAEKGRVKDGIPVWGLPSAVGTERGFMIFH